MILSNPYPKPGMARMAAKKQERCLSAGKFLVLYDPNKKWFQFIEGDTKPDTNLIAVERHELVNGKWRDRTPLGKVVCDGGYIKREQAYPSASEI